MSLLTFQHSDSVSVSDDCSFNAGHAADDAQQLLLKHIATGQTRERKGEEQEY